MAAFALSLYTMTKLHPAKPAFLSAKVPSFLPLTSVSPDLRSVELSTAVRHRDQVVNRIDWILMTVTSWQSLLLTTLSVGLFLKKLRTSLPAIQSMLFYISANIVYNTSYLRRLRLSALNTSQPSHRKPCYLFIISQSFNGRRPLCDGVHLCGKEGSQILGNESKPFPI